MSRPTAKDVKDIRIDYIHACHTYDETIKEWNVVNERKIKAYEEKERLENVWINILMEDGKNA